MIFYFSGTGNSLYVAKKISEFNGEELISVAKEIRQSKGPYKYSLRDGEKIGIIFPVYAWAPPRMVENFLKAIEFENYHDNYCFAIGVCGDSAGKTIQRVSGILAGKGIKLNSGFIMAMPNNYIIMFNTDSKDLERKKLKEAAETIDKINEIIKEERSLVYEDKGLKKAISAILTGAINPLFNKFSVNNCRSFYAEETCTGCGVCEKVCPNGNIKVDNKPRWGNKCMQCTACLHWCPAKAAQFGQRTVHKGRYTNPEIGVEEMYLR